MGKTGKVETTKPDRLSPDRASSKVPAKMEPAEGATLSDFLTASMSPNSLVIAWVKQLPIN
jgi:hypothetical protein